MDLTSSTYSYLKGETEDSGMDMTIIEAAEKLAEGETSGVIEIEGVGYYVIHLDADHDSDASENKRSALQTDAFNTLLDSWKESITWTVDEKAWAKVEFKSLFKAPEVEESTEETTEETDTTADETTEETTEETEAN